MAALLNKCKAIFAELPRVKRQLQNNTYGTDLFDIKDGISHFIANGIGTQVTDAVQNFLAIALGCDEHGNKIRKMDQTRGFLPR
jgi:hypothetical protein